MKVGFTLEKDEFEYDIRGLLMAFYPGADIIQDPEPEDAVDVLWNVPTCDLPGRVDRKTWMKDVMYRRISEATGITLPWGTLTGIRPTKLAMAELLAGKSIAEAAEVMEKIHLVSPEKSLLSANIAAREREILKNIDYTDGYSLYIGIPFCPTTCLYCSFTSYPMSRWEPRMGEYLDALEKEIDFTAERFGNKKLNTIYIGGGTPTSLPPALMERLLSRLEKTFSYQDLQEFTVEGGRPDSITPEKLAVLKNHPVTRISINPQTMNEATLRRIGRRHTVQDIRDAYAMAREMGFDNINMDIILGLPEETPADVAHTLKEIQKLSPDSLTVHSLAVKRASRLKMEAEGTVVAGGTQEESEEMMRLSQEAAAAMGMEPYYLYRQKNMAGNLENTGYARDGKAGIYNILIMEEKQTIVALGAGTVTKGVFPPDRIERCENVKDIEQYLARIDEMIERKRKLFS
ncbi:MAG: coproporphyrinogen dehydrogenase HemZ [Lachnospiraceae bacterium]|nr:coproporphyrinogen dehydrogenase HemZ [Lachnospiraceae bacterium]